MQERALNILVGKQKQCIDVTHSGLVDCCEFACCGFAQDTINLSIAPVGIALGSSDRSIATADDDNAHPLPPHPRVPISAGASISLVSSETMISPRVVIFVVVVVVGGGVLVAPPLPSSDNIDCYVYFLRARLL